MRQQDIRYLIMHRGTSAEYDGLIHSWNRVVMFRIEREILDLRLDRNSSLTTDVIKTIMFTLISRSTCREHVV